MSAAINRAILFKNRSVPAETVDSGEAYFFLVGQTLKYKADDQQVYTLATGVSPEEVQDIIGSFISAGSNKVSVSYNDASNTLVIDVVPGNIPHQNLSGAGTNTHAQIDSHISSTSNPHGTTASQVGADPAGTASSAIASHLAASDPHPQYETSSEAQAKVDAHANRTDNPHATTKAQVGLSAVPNVDTTNPANITWSSSYRTVTDTEKTTWNAKEPAISSGTTSQYWRGDKSWRDFGTDVRASVLTGLASGLNQAITAGDTILSAFQNLQAQVSSTASSLAALILTVAGKANISGGNTFSGTQTVQETSSFATSAVKSSAANQGSMFDSKNDLNEYTELGTFGSTNPNTLFGQAMARVSFLFSSAQKFVIGTFNSSPIIFGTNAIARIRIEAAGQLNVLGNDITEALTGVTFTDAAVNSTDTLKAAIGKLQGQMTQRVSDFNAAQAVQDARLGALEATDAEWDEMITTGSSSSNSSSTWSTISGLLKNTTAGKTYYCEYTIPFQTASITTGIALSMGLTGGGTISAIANIPVAADGTAALFTGHITASGDGVTGTGVQAANTTYVATIRGIFICTTSGTLFPQFHSEVSLSNVTVMAGATALIREF